MKIQLGFIAVWVSDVKEMTVVLARSNKTNRFVAVAAAQALVDSVRFNQAFSSDSSYMPVLATPKELV